MAEIIWLKVLTSNLSPMTTAEGGNPSRWTGGMRRRLSYGEGCCNVHCKDDFVSMKLMVIIRKCDMDWVFKRLFFTLLMFWWSQVSCSQSFLTLKNDFYLYQILRLLILIMTLSMLLLFVKMNVIRLTQFSNLQKVKLTVKFLLLFNFFHY